MKTFTALLMLVGLACQSLQSQVCDPSLAPTGLNATYTEGVGVLLEWDAVPGSTGVQLKVDLPSGSSIYRNRIGSSIGLLFVPEWLLTPGTYTWRVQAACSSIPPYVVTPISASSSFTIGEVSCPASVTDIDGNVYSTVQIGEQCWMAENLKVERYRNGDILPTGLSNSAWISMTSGAFAVYNNTATNKDTYGLLYNWFAAVDPRGLCPTGWHVPTDAEWTELTDLLGGQSDAGGKMKTTGSLEAGTGLWRAPNTAATNSSGFSGLPGGFRDYNNGNFGNKGFYGYWWSSSEYSTLVAWGRVLNYFGGEAFRDNAYMNYGFSVRCLRD